ncbi:MAG: A/G-specific adenine glycosylase [Gammaproteobacteria bacterium]|nr:A/G-specific adenine glycosylase [Gammaproteobacteria bacterium]
MTSFASLLLHWFHQHGRKTLPWQQDIHPYRVWVSEIMLQQTQVKTVIPYFERFMEAFPDIQSLALATEDQVLKHWAGLGYYARGRNLHRSAQIIQSEWGGQFPQALSQVQSLPGLGRSTASAILAICMSQPHPILDGNVKRVLARYFGISGYPGDKKIEAQLWEKAEACLPQQDIPDYTQAIMDLGAMICLPRNPQCAQCPVQKNCIANATHQTASLPTPKPKKAVPTKTAFFVIARYRDHILLEKRPSKGIWGGLWCPPEFTTEIDLNAFIHNRSIQILAPRQHQFTHYRLLFTPYLMEAETAFCHDKIHLWVPIKELSQYAFPAPISLILPIPPLMEDPLR